MDRQDIDALLIGALYGELTPAEEARLATHLDSHPADRGALDDLKVARQAVLDSRIFAVQAEPPQAISALLLQEAHRRAPKRAPVAEEKESWFYRFTRTFLAHPAMAAAAMLVLVLGGASIVYMRKGDPFAGKEVAAPAETAADRTSPPNEPAPTATATPEGAAAGSAYNAQLYEGQGGEAAIAPGAKDAEKADSAQATRDRASAEDMGKLKKAAPSRGIAVGTDKGAVKELERHGASANDDGLGFGGDIGGAKGGGGGAATGAAMGRADSNSGYAQPPPPPPSAAPSTITQNKPSATAPPAAPRAPEPAADGKKAAPAPAKVATATKAPAPESPAEAPKQEAAKPADSSLVAWAKGEHARAVALAQKGDCTTAAKVALGVSTRASGYYAQYMATDRALKQCAQYINAERDKEAEKSSKARAAKRTNADEPASVK